MHKTNLIATAMLAFGLGGFTQSMLTTSTAEKIRESMVYEFKYFIYDMEEDVEDGLIDSSVANYYIHNFKVIKSELEWYPEKYVEWYE